MGLTHADREHLKLGEPDKYFPSGDKNYVRVVASDDNQGKIGVQYMKKLGVKKVYILDDKELYGKGVADEMEAAASSRARSPNAGRPAVQRPRRRPRGPRR